MDGQRLLGWPTWVGIVVEDLPRERQFWAELLGVPEDHSGPDFVDFEMGGGRSFELIRRSDDPEYDGKRFQVGFAVDDIQAVRTELLRRGVEPIGDIVDDEAGSQWAYFCYPEGNVFEIKQRAPKEDRANEGGVHP